MIITTTEQNYLAERSMVVCQNKGTQRETADEVNDMLGLYLRFSGGRDDIATTYKAKAEAALAQWRESRGW